MPKTTKLKTPMCSYLIGTDLWVNEYLIFHKKKLYTTVLHIFNKENGVIAL